MSLIQIAILTIQLIRDKFNNYFHFSLLISDKKHTRLHRLTQPPALANTYGCVSQRSRMCKQGGYGVELQKQVVDNSDSAKHPPEDCNYRPWAIIT